MLLSESVALLGEQGKYFSDVYKLYEYHDNQLLKDYLDFVIHEPAEWMRGFPAKLVNKGSFSKPKTALIKLLKQPVVVNALGEDYVKHVHDVVWSTFKKHSEEIIAKRQKSVAVSILDQLDEDSVHSDQGRPQLEIQEEPVDDVVSLYSMNGPPRSSVIPPLVVCEEAKWESRYRILESAYRDLIDDLSVTCPGLTRSALRLLDGLCDV
jgi:hypothetical protein